MKPLGRLFMRFKTCKDGVLYYEIDVEIKGEKKKLLVPRYHAFLGWIEIFGLPPQNEWCVLKQLKPFEREGTLKIDGEELKERVIFNPDFERKMHSIITVRKGSGDYEYFQWFEDFSRAPGKIEEAGIFTHSNGVYRYFCRKEGSKSGREDELAPERFLRREKLPISVEEKIREISEDKGRPDSMWLKNFEAKGALPRIYYKMFPTEVLDLNLENSAGKVIELGYLNKSGGEIDRVHGEWYKFFTFEKDDRAFFIREGEWSSTEAEIDGRKERIKNTYGKRLFLLE